MRDRYGRNTFGQSCLLARRLVEAGTRFVEVNWPKVANSDNHSWDVHAGSVGAHEEPVGADARRRPVGADRRPGRARPAERNAGGGGRRVRPQPAARRQHLGQRQQRRRPRSLALLLHGVSSPAPASSAASSTASRTRPRRRPLENPVHPTELLATIYHSVGIDPGTMVYNHLNQPRELVQGEVVRGVFWGNDWHLRNGEPGA